jgi:hypothetical protein
LFQGLAAPTSPPCHSFFAERGRKALPRSSATLFPGAQTKCLSAPRVDICGAEDLLHERFVFVGITDERAERFVVDFVPARLDRRYVNNVRAIVLMPAGKHCFPPEFCLSFTIPKKISLSQRKSALKGKIFKNVLILREFSLK